MHGRVIVVSQILGIEWEAVATKHDRQHQYPAGVRSCTEVQ